jgi:hypothetical protein
VPLSITAYGRGLPTISETGQIDFYCVYAPTESHPFKEIVVRAQFITDDGSAILCDPAPTWFEFINKPDPESFRGVLRFSYDLQEYQQEEYLQYYQPPIIEDVSPARLSQSQSEVVVMLKGANFFDTAKEMACIATEVGSDGILGERYASSLILFKSATGVQCTFLALPRGHYRLAFSLNSVQFVDSPVLIQIVVAMQILDATPATLSSRAKD